MNKKQHTHKNNKKYKNSHHNCTNKCLETLKNSKTIQQGVSLLKDTAIGLGSLIITAVSEITDSIKTLNKNKN